MKKSLLAYGAALLAFTAQAEDAPAFTYKLLKDARTDITLPTYSSEEKKIVLDQAYMVLNEIFVHRELKLEHFGASSDPLPLLKKMESNVETYSDKEFHDEIADIFTNVHDLHTSYTFPKPLNCYRSLLPISFKEVSDLKGEKVIAVNRLSGIEEIKKLVPGLSIKLGDILLTYNGKNAYKMIKDLAPRSYGANPDAKLRRAVDLLSFISHRYNHLPESDHVELVLKNRQGEIYSLKLPWIERIDQECLKPEEKEETEEGMGTDDYLLDMNRVFRPQKKKTSLKTFNSFNNLQTTAEPVLSYKIVKNEYGDFGYILLESFVPEKLTDTELVLEVKRLLLTELAQTDGLIFDVRSNGGGLIWIAEALVQLFTPKTTVPLKFRLRNSPANRHFMYTTAPDNVWTKALKEIEASSVINTPDMNLAAPETLDQVGQYYFKPVAVFTDSSCYSSCDMFSAQMQDHGAAIIFGEDSTTGAGGANNRSHSDAVKQLKDDLGPYKKLPGGQNIGYSFRQTVRSGKSEGKLIEDTGVLSDQVASASLSDLYTGSGDQFKTIGKVLNQMASKFTSRVTIPDVREDLKASEQPKVLIKWQDTDQIEVRSNRKTIEKFETELNNEDGRHFALPRKNPEANIESGDYELIGFKNGERVWRKFYKYRLVPDAVPFNEPRDVKLEELAIFNNSTKDENGWIIKDGVLKIGTAEEYVDQVNSQASLFLNLSSEKTFTLNFEAEVNSEKDFDFLRVRITSEGKTVDLIKGLSGDESLKAYSFDLSAYKGKSVEISFIFETDTGVYGKGPKVQNISLK